MDRPAARAGGRGHLRPHEQRPHPSQREGPPVARRQASGSVHAGPAQLSAEPDHWLGRRPVPVAIAGAGTIAFSGILVRLADVSPETAAVFRCAYAVPILAALAWRESRLYGGRPLRERMLGMAAGVLFAADLICWHRSIADVGAGLATVLGNLQVVLVAFIAWAMLGERPGNRVLVAVPVVFTGAVMISGVLEQGAYGDNPGRGTLYGLLTTLAYAGFILVLRQTNADLRRPAGPLLDASLTAAIVATLFGAAIADVDLVPSWPAHGWLLLL